MNLIFKVIASIAIVMSSYGMDTNSISIKFNYLENKYEALKPEAEKDFKEIPGERLDINIENKKNYYEGFLESLACSPFDNDLIELHGLKGSGEDFSKKLQGMIKILPEIGFFKVFATKKPQPKNIFEDIILSAEFIYEIVKEKTEAQEKSLVLSLGRTPGLIHLAYQEVLKLTENKNQYAAQLSFSGVPDMDIKRQSSFYQEHPETAIVRNMVTESKLNHYFQYMDHIKFKDFNNVYILDMMGTGASLNSFLKILKAYFKVRGIKEPNLEFFFVTPDLNAECFNENDLKIVYSSETERNGTLFFPENIFVNLQKLSIKTTIIPVCPVTICQVLDNDFYQYFFGIGIEYPAQKWIKKYDKDRNNNGIYYNSLEKILKKMISQYIVFHEVLSTCEEFLMVD